MPFWLKYGILFPNPPTLHLSHSKPLVTVMLAVISSRMTAALYIFRVPVPAVQALTWLCHASSSLARDLVASLLA